MYKNCESTPEQSNTVLVDLEPESAQTCSEHAAVVFRATTVPAGSDVDVLVDRGDPDTVSSSFPFSRRFVPGLHMVTVSPSRGSEGLSAEVGAFAVKIEVLEPADKRTALPAEFFLEPCVSHRLPWRVVRV